MMLLAAQPPPTLDFATRRQHSPLAFAPSSAAPPDLTFSPAASDVDFPLDDWAAAPLIARFQDSLAFDGGASPARPDDLMARAPAWPAAASPAAAYTPSAPPSAAYHRAPAPRSAAPTAAPRSTASTSSGLTATNWQSFGGARFNGQLAGHKRNHSGSTVASGGPASPFTPLQTYPHIHDPDQAHYPSPLLDTFDLYPHKSAGSATTFSDTYYPAYAYAPPAQHDPRLVYQAAMRRAMMAPDGSEQPPALPRASTGEFDSGFKATMEAQAPKDHLYTEDFYSVAGNTPQPTAPSAATQREVFAQLLHAASNSHLARSDGGASGERSPFQPTSPYADEAPMVSSAAQLRERQKAASDALVFAQHHRRPSAEEPRTISPKDAFLDARAEPDAEYGPPLFPAIPAETVPTPATLRRSASSAQPEFPPPLVSMESTRSDGSSHSHSHGEDPPQRPRHTTSDAGSYTCASPGCPLRFDSPVKLQRHRRDAHRPTSPRVSAPTQTQAPASPLSPDEPLTPAMIAARNSQAGPHRCDRLNPATGKPCNAIFSRPYDLTRHEDTIHNVRKQKVRCPFCTDDKTFSRADALTRHLRVVHPERDAPGRRRRH